MSGQSPRLIVEREGPIVIAAMNRPERRNAFRLEMPVRMDDAWVLLSEDPELRGTSNPKAWATVSTCLTVAPASITTTSMSGRGLAEGSAARRGLRLLARAVAILIIVLVAGELALRGASRFVDRRATAWRPGAEFRILCVGDSHTYGIGVDERESYPAQLQALLEARHAGRYSTINLGIPGMSSTQVRKRLPGHVARYDPELVIVWCGSNNAWNRAEVGGGAAGGGSLLSGIAYRSRFYRLLRVWLHDRKLESWPTETRADGTHQQSEVDLRVPGREDWELRHGGIVERLRNDRAPARADGEMEERARRDFAAMAAWLRAAGIPMVLVQYPLEVGPYALANRAMSRVAAEQGLALVDSPAALDRVPLEQRRWLRGRHPSSPIYREIAADLVPIVTVASGGQGAPELAGTEGETSSEGRPAAR